MPNNPPSDPQEGDGPYTYSDAMNAWAEQKSFLRRTKGGVNHGAGQPGTGQKIFRILWKSILVAVLAMAGYTYFLKKHVATKAFADGVAGAIQPVLGAESVTLKPFRWKKGAAVVPAFSASGSDGGFFRNLSGSYLRFESSLFALTSPEWDLGQIAIDSLDLELRSGRLESVAKAGQEARTLRVPRARDFPQSVRAAGFSLVPALETPRFDSILATHLLLHWGLSDATRGQFTARDARFFPDGDAWKIDAASGVFDLGWWRQLSLREPLSVRYGDGQIRLERCVMAMPSGGSVTAIGGVKTGTIPDVNLTMTLEAISVQDLLPEDSPLRDFIKGKVDGEAQLTGSTNTSRGIVSNVYGTFRDATLRNLPVFETLAIATSKSLFRLLPLDGTFVLSTAPGRSQVSEIDLFSGESVRLLGAFEVALVVPKKEGAAKGKRKKTRNRATAPLILETENPAEKEEERVAHFSGALELGVAASVLERQPIIRDQHFEKREDGFYWIVIDLSGPAETLTQDLADRLSADLLEASQQ